ncbi:L,D-transpeptidase [Ramlibacter pallidus]|uniref:L,D-transpeptidase n=1 Tax=Ramlibacter pallidus TaxID=2780087 RepID=A0ABR9RXR6_9BURK|nr:L,D-transpeptidase [Ramlibacter pallidus]MBE7366043.1 L,D-transpeptidase [Ramlibacter pallidus]
MNSCAPRRRFLALVAGACLAAACGIASAAPATPADFAALYRSVVDRRLEVPAEEVQRYARLAEDALVRANLFPAGAQYLAVVDRDPQVQALLLLWRSAAGSYQLVGASPVSTGSPGSFDHFETPLGVFDHTVGNPDFRAEGTFNENGIRGYGAKGMRVFDLGWQRVPKGWGDGAVVEMRLQMHATDPDVLEQRLGSPQSKGCIRIPATLNRLLDHHGVLDAEYERAAREGRTMWVLQDDRDVVPDAGRYVVVVDSGRQDRPQWSPAPVLPHRRVAPARPAR